MIDLAVNDVNVRLNNLKSLIEENPSKIIEGWVNLHVHTNESFSVFKSPSEAVWYACKEGVEYFGINDHYTIDGHPEFRAACQITDLKATFSIEAIAMEPQSLKEGKRYNDPDNPGRIYLIGKGVIRDLKKGGKGYTILHTMKSAIQKRNRKIVEKMNELLKEKGIFIKLGFNEVLNLTPRGNATERHVVQAFCERIDNFVRNFDHKREIYKKLLNNDIEEGILLNPSELQNFVRARLVKSGKPCYVEEDESAFTSIENLVDIHIEYGAVPTYPFMGNPVTEEEVNLEELIKKVIKLRMYAFDIIDQRTGEKRVREIIDIASLYGFPVFIGTEHNTKRMLPLVGDNAKNPEFNEYFKKSAQFVLGHQILSELCDFGYVTPDGKPRFGDLKEGFRFFSEAGKRILSPERREELKRKTLKERKRFFGIE